MTVQDPGDWRWFNGGLMAVKRTDALTYTVWKWVDRDGWGASVDVMLENQLVKDFGHASSCVSWTEAVRVARDNALSRLSHLKTLLEDG